MYLSGSNNTMWHFNQIENNTDKSLLLFSLNLNCIKSNWKQILDIIQVIYVSDKLNFILIKRIGTRTEYYGMLGMKERAYLINANLHIESIPEKGTTIRVECNND